jgi:anthranilate synthase component II
VTARLDGRNGPLEKGIDVRGAMPLPRGTATMPRVTIIDNYDSFTFNLVHYLGELGATTQVVRNDAATVDDILSEEPDAIVLSPGPCTPREAGICCDLVTAAGAYVPTLGVCLGHQAIADAYGAVVVRAPLPMHGKLSRIEHRGETLFRGINGPFEAVRYHSLIVDRASVGDQLLITAWTGDALVMGLSHVRHPVHGVQFHPESIESEHGRTILKNFLERARAWNQQSRADRPRTTLASAGREP